jgi:hypothetical protein
MTIVRVRANVGTTRHSSATRAVFTITIRNVLVVTHAVANTVVGLLNISRKLRADIMRKNEN